MTQVRQKDRSCIIYCKFFYGNNAYDAVFVLIDRAT